MSRKTKRGGRKKTQRIESLSKRRASQPDLFKAIERRQQQQRAALQAARKSCIKTTGHPEASTIERRRQEYLEIPAVAPPPIPPRLIVASLAIAFALPIVVAVATNLAHPSQHIVASRPHPRAAMHAPNVAVELARPSTTPHPRNVAVELARPSTTPHPPNVTVELARRPTASHAPKVAVELARPSPSPASVAVGLAQTPPLQRTVKANRSAPAQLPQPKTLATPLSSRILASVLRAILGTVELPAETQKLAQRPTPLPAMHQPRNKVAARVHSRPPAVKTPPILARTKSSSPWSLNPDGTWTALVRAPTTLRDPSFSTSSGRLLQLERSAIFGNAAVVTIAAARPVSVTISSSQASHSVTLPAPDDQADAFDVSARAIGPYLVNVGWTPLNRTAGVTEYEVYRSNAEGGRPQLIASLPATAHALHDRDVDPGSGYRYSVVAQTANDSVRASTPTITTPAELAAASSRVLSGKGMFLYFSSLPYDARNFHNYNPEAVIAEAQRTGIHVIELRMARGSCVMAQTQEARTWLDRLIDAAAHANISLIAWTVPRRATTEDVAQTVEAASHTTPEGNGFVGLALDLETGDRYMGQGPEARDSMVRYIDEVRAAVGPRYLIVATVVSPEMGHHTNSDYPYARIAAFADVLQPMEYWHYFDEASHHAYARREVAGAAQAAVARTRELAGRDIPVNVAGQSVDLEGTGAPSGREISWSLGGAKSEGAIGETFFDWAGTPPDAWAAIQAFDW